MTDRDDTRGSAMTDLDKVGCAFARTAAAYKAESLALSQIIIALKHSDACECGNCQMIDVTSAALRAPAVLAAMRR